MKYPIRLLMLLRKRKASPQLTELPSITPVEQRVVVALTYPVRLRRKLSITTVGGAPRHTNQMSS